jgi:excisionase family DNA binding protein
LPTASHCIAGVLREAKPLLPKFQVMTKATEAKFSIKEVAQRFRVHATTVYRLMDKGKLGFYQIGSRRIIGESHIEQYLSLAERKAKTTAPHPGR